MHCKNCGKQSDGSKKFCMNCGTALAASQVHAMQPSSTMPIGAKKEPWSFGRIAKIVVGVVIVGGLITLKVVGFADSSAVDTNNNAIANFDSGNSEQAISQFQQASQSAVTTDTKINTLKNLAYVYSSEGQNDKALETFKQAQALTTDGTFEYYLISGEIAVLEGKPNSAQISYTKAYQLDANNFQINNALALFYMDIDESAPQYQDYKKALTYAQKAVQLTDLEIAKQNLGMAYYFNDMYTQSISTFNSISLDKETYGNYFIGLSYAGLKDPVNAKLYLRKAIANGMTVPQEVYDYIENN